MLKHRILLMNDGLDHNVIKIKPPLCFTKDNADAVLQAIDETLGELLNWTTWLVNSLSKIYLYYIVYTTVHITILIYSKFFHFVDDLCIFLCKTGVNQKPYFICVCRRVAAAWDQWFLNSSSRAFACKKQSNTQMWLSFSIFMHAVIGCQVKKNHPSVKNRRRERPRHWRTSTAEARDAWDHNDQWTNKWHNSPIILSLVYLVSKIVELVFPFLHTCRSIHFGLKNRKRKESKFNVTKLIPQMAPKCLA